MKITYCGHACLMVEEAGLTLVTDPWFSKTGAFAYSWFQFPDNTDMDLERIRQADYVFITHSHADHLDRDFIRTLPSTVKILIPQYPNGRLKSLIEKELGRHAIEVPAKKSFSLGEDFEICAVPQRIPYQEDCALVVRSKERCILNANDTKLTQDDLAWIRDHHAPEFLFIQFSGASWHPFVYNYPSEKKADLARTKIKNKYHHVWSAMEGVGAKYLIPFAGPPCFLDDEYFGLNFSEDSYFPTTKDFFDHAEVKGKSSSVCCLVPGEVVPWLADYSVFSREIVSRPPYSDRRNYLERYRARRRSLIEKSLSEEYADDGLPLLDAAKNFFEPLMHSSAYLRGRIGGAVLIESVGQVRESILLDFLRGRGQVRYSSGEPWIYKFTVPAPLLKAALSGKLPWEDLFLSLRFRADRNPDSYSEHLTVFFRFASCDIAAALVNYEEFERYHRLQDVSASFVCEHEGRNYTVQRYCPHAWADLSKGVIENGAVICPGHGWAFRLSDGRCLGNQASIRVKREE